MLQHTTVVEARIKTIPALASKTFIGEAPRDTSGALPQAPYVVVYPADGTDTQDRFLGAHATMHPRFTIHAVGASYTNAQTVMELVKAKFIVAGFGIQLTVPDELSRACRWESPQPVQVDNDVAPPLIYATAELSWDSDPI